MNANVSYCVAVLPFTTFYVINVCYQFGCGHAIYIYSQCASGSVLVRSAAFAVADERYDRYRDEAMVEAL